MLEVFQMYLKLFRTELFMAAIQGFSHVEFAPGTAGDF